MTKSTRIRDRIKELRRVRASELIPHQKNFRTHPEHQRAALRSILSHIGYADALLARETPEGLVLIDGHLRAEVTPDMEVPVLILDVTEQEADLLLASLDPMAAMAGQSDELLKELLAGIETQSDALRAMWEEPASDCYPRVSCPTVIIPAGPTPERASTERARVKQERVEAAARGITNSRVNWIPETVHDIGYHKPQELARVIRKFLAESSTAT